MCVLIWHMHLMYVCVVLWCDGSSLMDQIAGASVNPTSGGTEW